MSGQGTDDDGRHRFLADLQELAPELQRGEALWEVLASVRPHAQGNPGEVARIRQDLMDQPRPRASPLVAWWREFGVMPGRAIGVASATTAGVLALYALAPMMTVQGHRLAWMGLFGPWLGVLWSLAVSMRGEGPWSDWEAMAPVGYGARATAGLALVAVVAAACAALGALAEPATASGGWPVFLLWAGPFSLGAVGAIALAWRWGTGTAVVVSAAVWGLPLGVGTAIAGNAWGVARWLMWYALPPSGGRATAIDVACFAVACLVAAWTVWGRATWTSDLSR